MTLLPNVPPPSIPDRGLQPGMRLRQRFWSALNLFLPPLQQSAISHSRLLRAAPPDTTPPVISNLSFTSGPMPPGLVSLPGQRGEMEPGQCDFNVANYLFGPGVSVTQAALGPGDRKCTTTLATLANSDTEHLW